MPFKSNAQRRRFEELVKSGQMTQKTFDKYESETGDAKLPERLTKKKPKKPTKASLKGRFGV